MGWFTRPHRHDWDGGFRYSGAANVSRYQQCSCGERRELGLTEAGYQQVGWWVQIFPEWEPSAIMNGVEFGWLPYPFVWTGAQPDGSLGRLLTRDEALGLIEDMAA